MNENDVVHMRCVSCYEATVNSSSIVNSCADKNAAVNQMRKSGSAGRGVKEGDADAAPGDKSSPNPTLLNPSSSPPVDAAAEKLPKLRRARARAGSTDYYDDTYSVGECGALDLDEVPLAASPTADASAAAPALRTVSLSRLLTAGSGAHASAVVSPESSAHTKSDETSETASATLNGSAVSPNGAAVGTGDSGTLGDLFRHYGRVPEPSNGSPQTARSMREQLLLRLSSASGSSSQPQQQKLLSASTPTPNRAHPRRPPDSALTAAALLAGAAHASRSPNAARASRLSCLANCVAAPALRRRSLSRTAPRPEVEEPSPDEFEFEALDPQSASQLRPLVHFTAARRCSGDSPAFDIPEPPAPPEDEDHPLDFGDSASKRRSTLPAIETDEQQLQSLAQSPTLTPKSPGPGGGPKTQQNGAVRGPQAPRGALLAHMRMQCSQEVSEEDEQCTGPTNSIVAGRWQHGTQNESPTTPSELPAPKHNPPAPAPTANRNGVGALRDGDRSASRALPSNDRPPPPTNSASCKAQVQEHVLKEGTQKGALYTSASGRASEAAARDAVREHVGAHPAIPPPTGACGRAAPDLDLAAAFVAARRRVLNEKSVSLSSSLAPVTGDTEPRDVVLVIRVGALIVCYYFL